MIYFNVEQSPYSKTGEYMIMYRPAFYNFFRYTDSSYRVYEARLFGLTFASYLRMVRDQYNAHIFGKGHKYPTVYYSNKQDAERIAKELDSRLLYLIKNLKNCTNVPANTL